MKRRLCIALLLAILVVGCVEAMDRRKGRKHVKKDYCVSVRHCNTKCKASYDRNRIPKPIMMKSLDKKRSHLACCESGCYRRTSRNIKQCLASCESSDWVIRRRANPDNDPFDAAQLKRNASQRLPTHPTFLETDVAILHRTSNSTNKQKKPHKHGKAPRYAKAVKGPIMSAAEAKAALQGPPYGGSDENDRIDFGLSPSASSPAAPVGIPADVIAYMRRQHEDSSTKKWGASLQVPGGTYLTNEEKRRNVGHYHKQLCKLGCHLRCPPINQDRVKGPVEQKQ